MRSKRRSNQEILKDKIVDVAQSSLPEMKAGEVKEDREVQLKVKIKKPRGPPKKALIDTTKLLGS